MYCKKCGIKLSESAKFCTGCGNKTDADYSADNGPPIGNNIAAGFSPKINSPEFKKHINSSRKWAVIFALILATAALTGFPAYGIISGEMDFLPSLIYGLVIALIFILIALVQLIKQSRETTWDGIIVDKKVTKRQVAVNQEQGSYNTEYVYNLIVKRADGKIKTDKYYNDSSIYDYYNVGDSVRHHKGFSFFEKYDKSRDSIIICVFCGTKNSISSEKCSKCKLLLLN